MMILHIFWIDIPSTVSAVSILICLVSMAFTLLTYGSRNMRVLQGQEKLDEK